MERFVPILMSAIAARARAFRPRLPRKSVSIKPLTRSHSGWSADSVPALCFSAFPVDSVLVTFPNSGQSARVYGLIFLELKKPCAHNGSGENQRSYLVEFGMI